MSSIIITATKSFPNNPRRKPSVVTETVESFTACRKRMQEIAKPFALAGLTVTPTSRVDFKATGKVLEGTKVVDVEVTVVARYADKVSRVVTDKPSIVLTKRWEERVAATR